MRIIKISVIVPCYNQAQFLDEALQSVFNQTETDWECIIVNDGSTDESKSIAENWAKKDKRFKCFNQNNSGLCSARNFGIKKAQGEFILPLDADDKLGKDYLKLGLDAFENDNGLRVVYSLAEKFGEETGLWKLPDFNLYNLSRMNMIFCSAIFRKSDWEQVNGYDNNMIYGWEDWEFWIALLKNGGKVRQLDIVGFYYRVKSESMLKSIDNEKSKHLLNYLSIKHADFFVKYYGSFKEMEEKIYYKEFDLKQKLASKKFILHMFFKTFFKISLFKKYEQ